MPQGEYLQYGGQAIIEGVMMRSPHHVAVAVRAPNEEIVLVSEPIAKTWIGRQKWLKLPFLRGTLALLDSMGLGIRAMRFASEVQISPKYQPQPEGVEQPDEEPQIVRQGGGTMASMAVTGALIFGLVVGIFIFKVLPLAASEQFKRVGVHNSLGLNLITGLLQFAILLGYIYGISKLKEIHRVFCYHGAEHKAINTLEAEQELTLENCKAQTRLHPRCGTSFIIIVFMIDFFALLFVPRYLVASLPVWTNLVIRFGLNLALLPVFAGVAYEMIRFAGKFRNERFVKILFAPGLATQYITTAEPDEGQIEVALIALQACIDAEKRGAAPKKQEVDEDASAIA